MSEIKVLLVEDDRDALEMLSLVFEAAAFSVHAARNAQHARNVLGTMRPHVILLDWILPDMNGLEWMQALKKDEAFADVPVIFLTCRDHEDDKLAAFKAGADDYITKPFSPRELISRVRAVLRRTFMLGMSGRIKSGPIYLDNDEHRVRLAGRELLLSPTEYRLLEFLLAHPGKAYSRRQLLDRVWGFHRSIEERSIDVHIRRLRQKIGQNGDEDIIQTVRGFGYRLSLPRKVSA